MILQASGTQTISTIPNEYTLASLTTFATYVGFVDLSNMASGDTVVLNIYTQVLNGGGLNNCYSATYTGAQSASTGGVIAVSIPLPSDQTWKFTINQTTGTARTFPWKVISL